MESSNEQFSRIYDEYIQKIYRFVYLKVNSQEAAEDITSKVFLKSWESFSGKRKIKNPRAFLYQVARNSVIDYYRDKGRTTVVDMEKTPQLTDYKTNLYESAVLHAEIEKVKAAIQNIKPEYQDVIIWHYLDDLSAEEIAQIVKKPVGTVRVMIHRGLKSLKGELVQES
jgi:RNA polymerase sigma-70 factor (ECF subfamily)